MANISTLLARILSTRYGRDMRQDLHDAIEAVNDDTETALGKSLAFTTNTRKLKLLAKDNTLLSEVVIPGGGSGGGSVDSVNGLFPDENGNVEVNLDDINDVDITSAEDGDALIYDSTSGKWINGAGGGGTTDYTDLSNKPSVNGVTLSGNKTSADLGISGGSNENLLDNPWFTVNQKGFTSGSIATIGESVPFIDRWKGYWQTGNTSTVSLSNNQLTFTIPSGVGCGIQQGSEILTAYTSGTATVSIMFADDTILSKTIALTGTGYSNYQIGTYNDLLLEYRHYTSQNIFEFVFSNSTDSQKAVTIKAVKFELGSESTLALDTAPNYASELLKCQRYFYPLSGKSYNSMVSAMQQTRQFMTITLPTEMRAVPTFNGSLTTEGISGSTRVDDTVTSSNITVTNKQDIEFNFTTSNNFNLCSSARVSFLSGSYLSAEL